MAKIGINTGWVRRTLAEERYAQERLRQKIAGELILSLVIAAVLFLLMIYPWVRRLTRPLGKLVATVNDLDTVKAREFPLWLENVRQLNPKGQMEVLAMKKALLRLGTSIRKLGQRLITGESQALLGKMLGRFLTALQDRSIQLQALKGRVADQGALPPAARQERQTLVGELQARVQDLLRIWPAGKAEWQRLDLIPGIESAWRLATADLPAKVQAACDVKPLPEVWGSPVELPLAVLYLLEALAEPLKAGGRLRLKAAAAPAGGVRIMLEAAGERLAAMDWQEQLNLRQPSGELREQLGPALAAAIAAQHGGSLTVHSRGGKVVFSLELPPVAAVYES